MVKNDITLSPGRPAEPPVLSAQLRGAVAGYGGIDAALNRAPAAIISEAKAVLPALEAYLAPPTPAVVRLWLTRLRGGTREISDADFEQKLAAVSLASGDLPALAWSSQTLGEIFRRHTFFPEPAEIHAILWPIVRKSVFEMCHVRFLSRAKPIPERPPEQMLRLSPGMVAALTNWQAPDQMGEAYVPMQRGGEHGQEPVGPVPPTPPDFDPRNNPIVNAARAAREEVNGDRQKPAAQG